MESPGLPLSSGSLASRHRPRRFSDVVGQRHVKVPLQRAIVSHSLPQQLLFSGGSGLGKTTLARICAAALLCDSEAPAKVAGDCCGVCANCFDVAMGTHPDVIEIDAASNGRVDEVRELASRAYLAPMRGSHRVYIIDEAHGLSAAGGQAFLKLLEEPPSHVVFMLATTDPDKMLHTNRSRCTEFELAPPSRQEFVDNVRRVAAIEGVSISQLTASEVVAASASELGLRGTLMALEKILPSLRENPDADIAELLGRPSHAALMDLCTAISSGNSAVIVNSFSSLRSRFPVPQLLSSLADVLNFNLVEAALHRPAEVQTYIKASAIAVAANKDGSDLAALTAVLQLSGMELRLNAAPDPDIPSPAKVSESGTAAVPSAKSAGSGTGRAHVNSGSNRSLVDEPAPEIGHVPKLEPVLSVPSSTSESLGGASAQPQPANAGEVSSLYAVDPWAVPDPVDDPTPTLHQSGNDLATAQAELLAALAAKKTTQSRRLQATLRTLPCKLDDSVLTIEAPPSTLKILKEQYPILTEAAIACKLTVKLIPRP